MESKDFFLNSMSKPYMHDLLNKTIFHCQNFNTDVDLLHWNLSFQPKANPTSMGKCKIMNCMQKHKFWIYFCILSSKNNKKLEKKQWLPNKQAGFLQQDM
jgi:hypothetical protein